MFCDVAARQANKMGASLDAENRAGGTYARGDRLWACGAGLGLSLSVSHGREGLATAGDVQALLLATWYDLSDVMWEV
jgi:hypothetical protein